MKIQEVLNQEVSPKVMVDFGYCCMKGNTMLLGASPRIHALQHQKLIAACFMG